MRRAFSERTHLLHTTKTYYLHTPDVPCVGGITSTVKQTALLAFYKVLKHLEGPMYASCDVLGPWQKQLHVFHGVLQPKDIEARGCGKIDLA